MKDEFLKLMDDWEGFHSVRGAPLNEVALAKALNLIVNADGLSSHKREYLLKEAITTSDFPYLFAQILDRQILARYRVIVADWRTFTKVGTVLDFNKAYRHKIYGNDEYLPLVQEKKEYPTTPMGEARYELQVFKHGRRFDISWESIINDAMQAFADIDKRFADAAVRTVSRDTTALFAAAAGPHTELFGVPIVDVDGQNVTNRGVLALDITNLGTTLQLMGMQSDPNGEPVGIRGIHLVVPPSLELTARQILTSALQQHVNNAVAAVIPMPMTNVIPQLGVQLHVDPYLPRVDTSANRYTTWYVFADPSQGAAMEMDFLRGHEDPEICMKASDKVTVAGAALGPFSGDFASDGIEYRIRIVHGGNQLDPRFAYAQTGAGA